MNHLVTLEPRAGELEKILSGVKCMVVKEFDPAQSTVQPVSPGDTLYFLRDKDECALRVKATVVRILLVPKSLDEDLSHILKEMQPRLQLTEDQYNHWSAKKQLIMVEFDYAQKMGEIHVSTNNIPEKSSWISFEEFSSIS
jgi:hypothetical protein